MVLEKESCDATCIFPTSKLLSYGLVFSVFGQREGKRKKSLGSVFVHIDPITFFRLLTIRYVIVDVHLAVFPLNLSIDFLVPQSLYVNSELLEGRKSSSTLAS